MILRLHLVTRAFDGNTYLSVSKSVGLELYGSSQLVFLWQLPLLTRSFCRHCNTGFEDAWKSWSTTTEDNGVQSRRWG